MAFRTRNLSPPRPACVKRSPRLCFKSSGRSSTEPGEKSTARSMKFCKSRIFPGQACALRTAIISSGIESIVWLCGSDFTGSKRNRSTDHQIRSQF